MQVVKHSPETRLMLIGKLNSDVLNLADEYGITGQVICTGYVPYERFPTYLGCADIFLLPFPNTLYNVGRWPSKVCDYMASGRPIVSNPTGDVKLLFEAHNIGLLADESEEDFAAKINFLLSHPEISDVLGQNARQTAVNKYDWSILVNGLESFYINTLGRRE
jgi:glycosyltransferase involved in cell wall biosynthesis